MVIQHNLSALNANRQLGIVFNSLEKSTEKLSSGYKINRAADDAAGLSISEKMRKQIRGLSQAAENIQDGISLCQVADGALNETVDILQRMNELSIQAANGTNSISDRSAIQSEIDQLSSEINRIADTTSFNEWIYPLKSNTSYKSSLSQGAGNTGNISYTPISSSDLKLYATQINLSNITNYSSYIDIDGKTHYILPSDTIYTISELNNCVFDIKGNTIITDTSLKNVTIDCSSGTTLTVNNVTIDNSANVKNSIVGIGAALAFHGQNNSLKCYGSSEFNGGMDTYIRYSDAYDMPSLNIYNNPYYIPCAGVNVGNGTELQIYGTSTSLLKAHGCWSDEGISYGSEAGRMTSFGIGSNFHEDGGSIIINSGSIQAYSCIQETLGYYLGNGNAAIGGGKNFNVTINGGNISSYGCSYAIGGGDTYGDSLTGYGNGQITINGGDIYAIATNGGNSAIGIDGVGTINIAGGNIKAVSDIVQGAGIGFASGNNTNGNIYISGGVIDASTKGITAIGLARTMSGQSGVVSVSVDGTITNTQGIYDGTYTRYTYNNPTPPVTTALPDTINIPSTSNSNNTYNQSFKEYGSVWIQSTDEAHKGLYINLVDATMEGLFSGTPALSVLTETDCDTSIARIADALRVASSYRSYFGSIQNRLEHAYNINLNTVENTQFAESQIRDTDMASEMVKYSNSSILSQAGQAMLAQANQSNQGVLSLIA